MDLESLRRFFFRYCDLPFCLQRLQPVGVEAFPPRAVSRSSKGREQPTLYMASTISSKGIGWAMPERDSWAQVKALAVPMAFLLWQGDSTNPAMGSQTRPSRLDMAMDAADRHCAGVPPRSSVSALAAMAEAAPTSAWHPASAPDTEAFRISRYPTAPALSSPGEQGLVAQVLALADCKQTAGEARRKSRLWVRGDDQTHFAVYLKNRHRIGQRPGQCFAAKGNIREVLRHLRFWLAADQAAHGFRRGFDRFVGGVFHDLKRG